MLDRLVLDILKAQIIFSRSIYRKNIFITLNKFWEFSIVVGKLCNEFCTVQEFKIRAMPKKPKCSWLDATAVDGTPQ